MEKQDVIDALLKDARDNDADDAVVIDIPPEVLDELGAKYNEEGRPRISTTLVAGPIADENDEAVTLQTPSRVGTRDDFSSEVRKGLRPEGIYGFRDANLDDVPIPKKDEAVVIHRP